MSSVTTAKLVLLPGMGTDRRLFVEQERALGPIDVPAWIPPRRGETLASYGERMAGEVRLTEPFFLGGVSLGGMVALEMARHLNPQAVFLIGSCRSGSVVRRSLRWIEPLNALVPAAAFGLAKPFAGALVPGLKKEHRRLFTQMYRDIPGSFVKWACSAAVHWPGPPALAVPVHQIHGRYDRLLPTTRGVDQMIEDGGHLINLTHAEVVNAFLMARMRGF